MEVYMYIMLLHFHSVQLQKKTFRHLMLKHVTVFLLDYEDIYQQSFPIAPAETRDKCSLLRLEHQVT